jgi:hypothetical protein
VLDPSHIAPSRTDANSNGHFPVGNNQHFQAGTPRGFNANMAFPFQAGSNGFNPMAFFQNPMAGGAPFVMAGGADGMRSAGPMRRGRGGSDNMRRPGPYDRNPRNGSSAGISGRLTPPRGAGRPVGNMPNQWVDGRGGGPKEAVQGRMLKAYDDLDAVGGSGSGELNY